MPASLGLCAVFACTYSINCTVSLIYNTRLLLPYFNIECFNVHVLLQALQSLSLADSRLRQRGMVLVNALGSNACLRKVDLSGNLLEDSGAKMLSKALQINTTLRCVCVSF